MLSFAAGPALAPFVEAFTVVETDAPMTRTLVPDGRLTLGFRYRGYCEVIDGERATRVADVVVSGMRSSARRMHTSALGGIVIVGFRPGGAAAFLPMPLHELYATHAPLDALIGSHGIAETAERVSQAQGHEQRIAIISDYLLARRLPRARDPLVLAAVDAIRHAPAEARIQALAARLGLGQDRLEKRFRAVVGATPKQLASILRLRRAVDAYRPDASLAQLALNAGFFDQSHFVRALRAATHEPPRQFFRRAAWC
jgi:AraC-like DNA-binding protein